MLVVEVVVVYGVVSVSSGYDGSGASARYQWSFFLTIVVTLLRARLSLPVESRDRVTLRQVG